MRETTAPHFLSSTKLKIAKGKHFTSQVQKDFLAQHDPEIAKGMARYTPTTSFLPLRKRKK